MGHARSEHNERATLQGPSRGSPANPRRRLRRRADPAAGQRTCEEVSSRYRIHSHIPRSIAPNDASALSISYESSTLGRPGQTVGPRHSNPEVLSEELDETRLRDWPRRRLFRSRAAARSGGTLPRVIAFTVASICMQLRNFAS